MSPTSNITTKTKTRMATLRRPKPSARTLIRTKTMATPRKANAKRAPKRAKMAAAIAGVAGVGAATTTARDAADAAAALTPKTGKHARRQAAARRHGKDGSAT